MKRGIEIFLLFLLMLNGVALKADEKAIENIVKLKKIKTVLFDLEEKDLGGESVDEKIIDILPLSKGEQFLVLTQKLKTLKKDIDLENKTIKSDEKSYFINLVDPMGKRRIQQFLDIPELKGLDRFRTAIFRSGLEHDCSYLIWGGRAIMCLRYDFSILNQFEVPFKKIDGVAVFQVNGQKVLWVTGQSKDGSRNNGTGPHRRGLAILDIKNQKWKYKTISFENIELLLSDMKPRSENDFQYELLAAYPVQSADGTGSPRMLLEVYLESSVKKEIRFFLLKFNDEGVQTEVLPIKFKISIRPDADQIELNPDQLILQEKPSIPVYSKVYNYQNGLVLLRMEQVENPLVVQQNQVGSVLLQYGVLFSQNGQQSKLLNIPEAFEKFTMESMNEPGVIRKGLRFPMFVEDGNIYFMCEYFKNAATGGAYQSRKYGCIAVYRMIQ